MNANGQADIGYWQMIEMQKDPVAWMYRIKDTDNRWELIFNKPLNDDKFFDTIPLYTHPADLTDEEIIDVANGFSFIENGIERCKFARAILRKAQKK